MTPNHSGRLQQKTQIQWRSVASALLMTGLALQLTGCVSSSVHDELSRQYQEVLGERDDLIKKRDALAGNTRLLRNKVEITEAQKESIDQERQEIKGQLSNVNKALDNRNEALTKANTQLSMMREELDQTSEQLNATSQQLSAKNAALSATSEELVRKQNALKATSEQLNESNQKLQATADYIAKTNKLYDDLVKELSTELEANQIKINEMKDGVTVNLSEDILFPSGSAVLNKSGQTVIAKVSGKLKNIPHQIIVAGFTDNIPIRGTLAKVYPTNWELAGARAASVVRVLEASGLDSKKLSAVSFADTQPVAGNDTAEGRAQNRRIEIRLRPVE